MNATLAMELVRRNAPISDQDVAALNLDQALGELVAEVVREPRGSVTRPAGRRPFLGVRLTRPVLVVLAILAVLTAVAVPPVRAALNDLGNTLVDFFDGDNLPGRPLENSDNAPAWLEAEGLTGQRVLASSSVYSLYLVHESGGNFGFGLDGSVAISDTAAGWESQFADNSMVILGTGTRPDDQGRVPLYGVTAGNVANVELLYEDGSTRTAAAEAGGFVLMLDRARGPAKLVALDPNGAQLQVIDAHRFGTAGQSGNDAARSPRHPRAGMRHYDHTHRPPPGPGDVYLD
jgi:hypothetical protein